MIDDGKKIKKHLNLSNYLGMLNIYISSNLENVSRKVSQRWKRKVLQRLYLKHFAFFAKNFAVLRV